jgi:hypothetical protein
MKTTKDPTFVGDIAIETETRSRRARQVGGDNKRRFVRIQISSPMSLQRSKDSEGGFWPEGQWHVVNGHILNLSAGGVLVDLDEVVSAGDIVSLQLTLENVEQLRDVLGLVKRVDEDGDGCLAGVEFIRREYLLDHFTEAEIELLGDRPCSFNESVREALNKYVRHGEPSERQG